MVSKPVFYALRDRDDNSLSFIFKIGCEESYKVFRGKDEIPVRDFELEKISEAEYETYEAMGCAEELKVKRPSWWSRLLIKSGLNDKGDIIIPSILLAGLILVIMPLLLIVYIKFGPMLVLNIVIIFLSIVTSLLIAIGVLFGIACINKAYISEEYESATD